MLRSIRTPGAVVGAILLASVVAGCDAQSRSGASAGGRIATTSAPAAARPSLSPSDSPPPPLPPPVAADGSDYAACADRTCEVAVSGPVRIKLRDGTFSVTRVEAAVALDFALTLKEGGGGSGTLTGTCGSIFTFYLGGGGANIGCDAGGVPAWPAPMQGALRLQLIGWSAESAAVVRLVSG